MQIVFLILALSLSAFAQRNNPISVELKPQRPESQQEFELIFSIHENHHPGTNAFPIVKGLPKGSLLSKKKTEGYKEDFFFNRIKVINYNFKIKIEDTGNYPIEFVWTFAGKDNLLGKMTLPIARSLDQSALSVYISGVPDTLYVGEQFKFNIHYNAFDNLLSGPSIENVDWGMEFLGNFTDKKLKWQRSKNPKYSRQLKQEAYLAPLSAGLLKVPSMKFDYMKRGRPQEKVVKKKFGNSSFTSRTIVQEPIEAVARTQAKKIVVLETPKDNQPIFYKEMVGEYHWAVVQSSDTLKDGDPLKVDITVEGNGKPGLVAEPFWELPSIWNQGEPETRKSTQERSGQLWTTKTWSYYLYPTRSGDLDLGQLSFAYFNPKTKKYTTLKHRFKTVNVSGVAESIASVRQEIQAQDSSSKMMEHLAGLSLKRSWNPSLSVVIYVLSISLILMILVFCLPIWWPYWNNHERPVYRQLIRNSRKIISRLDGLSPGEIAGFEHQVNQFLMIESQIDVQTTARDLVYPQLNWSDEDKLIFKEFEDTWNEHFYGKSKTKMAHLKGSLKELSLLVKRRAHESL